MTSSARYWYRPRRASQNGVVASSSSSTSIGVGRKPARGEARGMRNFGKAGWTERNVRSRICGNKNFCSRYWFVLGPAPPRRMPTPATTSEELKETIAAAYPRLSPQLQRLSRFALEKPHDLALGTVAAVAQANDVQPSS